MKKHNKGGKIESSKEQAYENNKAQALVYPGPGAGSSGGAALKKGGKVGKRK